MGVERLRSVNIAAWVLQALFAGSLAILALDPMGLLNGPGIAAASLGLILVWKRRYVMAAFLGIMVASVSMIAQALTAICSNCTWAALGFAFAGIISLVKIREEHPVYTAALTAILCGALFSYAGVARAVLNEGAAAVHHEDRISPGPAGPARLYLSMSCPACKPVLEAFIEADPEGCHWIPVVIPAGYLEQGNEWLAEAGYTGAVIAASESPTGAVPSLIYDGRYYTGDREILESSYLTSMRDGQKE